MAEIKDVLASQQAETDAVTTLATAVQGAVAAIVSEAQQILALNQQIQALQNTTDLPQLDAVKVAIDTGTSNIMAQAQALQAALTPPAASQPTA